MVCEMKLRVPWVFIGAIRDIGDIGDIGCWVLGVEVRL